MKKSYLMTALLLLSGCSTKSFDVPHLEETPFKSYNFSFIQSPTTQLEIRDFRSATKANSEEVTKKVDAVLQRIFNNSGIKVQAASPNKFLLDIKDSKENVGSVGKESCIMLEAEFKFKLKNSGRSYNLSGQSFGCKQFKQLAGLTFGNDISIAYRSALESLFEHLEARGQEAR